MIEIDRHFWVYKCEATDSRMRPNGKKISEGCKVWGIKSSKYSDLNDKGNEWGVQGLCKECGRKRRLNASTGKIKGFKSKEAAQEYCDAMNNFNGDF